MVSFKTKMFLGTQLDEPYTIYILAKKKKKRWKDFFFQEIASFGKNAIIIKKKTHYTTKKYR